MSFLRNPTPPRLPDPEEQLSPPAWRALLQVLRLFFSQLDNLTQALTGRNGGQFLEFPTASYYNDVDQPLAAATPTSVLVPLFTEEQAINNVSPVQISVAFAGTYSVRAALSVRNDGALQTISVWLRKNLLDLPTSRIDESVPAGATVSVPVDYIIDLLPTDTIEIRIFAPGASVHLFPPPLAAGVPRGAAARVNITYVSNNSVAQVPSLLYRIKKRIFDPPP